MPFGSPIIHRIVNVKWHPQPLWYLAYWYLAIDEIGVPPVGSAASFAGNPEVGGGIHETSDIHAASHTWTETDLEDGSFVQFWTFGVGGSSFNSQGVRGIRIDGLQGISEGPPKLCPARVQWNVGATSFGHLQLQLVPESSILDRTTTLTDQTEHSPFSGSFDNREIITHGGAGASNFQINITDLKFN